MYEEEFKDGDFKKSSGTTKTWLVKTCVEVAIGKESVAVRNSNDPEKVTAHFTKPEWSAFIKGVKKNEFDV